MKTIISYFRILTFCLFILCYTASSQNITNTLGVSGLFKIKDNSTEFFTLSQVTGTTSINKTLELGNIQNSTTTDGVITKSGIRFIHNYSLPNTNGNNTFVGLYSGSFTLSGSGSNASFNTGMGVSCLSSLTTGSYNSGFGLNNLRFTTTGSNNTAFGYQSLSSNTTGFSNSALGSNALNANINGVNNSAFGLSSMANNISGSHNSAFGMYSLANNTAGNNNSAFGYYSLFTSTGISNTAFGYNTLYNTTGNNNTALGTFAGDDITIGSNNITIGYNTDVPSNTSNNQVRIGNTAITYAGIQVAWTITSDRRWKNNIVSSKLGLDFITKLRPVSYTRINDESQKTEYGFIAQELEEVLQKSGAENPGMITIDDKGNYELRYNDLLAPMVKAIQELKEENDKLKKEIESLKSLEERLTKLELTVMKNETLKEIKSVQK